MIIDFLNNTGPAVSFLRDEIEQRRVYATTVSLFEVLGGAHTRDQQRSVRLFFELVPALPFDFMAAGRAAEVDRELRAQGIRLATADTLIAGVALARGLPLITRNQRHFERVRGLELLTLK